MNRFLSPIICAALVAGTLWLAGGLAGAESPASSTLDPRFRGYPELTIRLTDERIEAPASVEAGRTVLIEENAGDGPGHAFVFRIPNDVPEAAVSEALAGASVAEGAPEWFWRADFLGNGDRATGDRPATALVDLQPGRYIIGDPYRPATEYARFEVTVPARGSAQPQPAPEADVTAELFEMGFTVPDQVAAGRQVWEVRNTGAMLHEIAIFPVPTGATADEVEAAISAELEAEFGGDPAQARATIDALGAEWAGWSSDLAAGVGVLSPRRASWAQFDLEPGTYGAVCFIPEPNSMTPHVMFGMADVFTVAPSA